MASQEHKDLANTIKGTHVKLRKAARERGSDEAWTMHVKNKDELKEYASAMHKLATEHWDKNDKNVSRIQWVVDVCQEYFKNGGYLSAQRKEKDLQRVYFSKELEASAVNDRDLGEVHFDKTFKGSEEKIGDLFGVNPNKVSKANEEKIGDLYGVDFNKELENSEVIDGVLHGIDFRKKLETNEGNFEGLNRIYYEKKLEVNDEGLNRIGSNKKIETSEEKHREIHIVDSNKKLDASEEKYRDSLIVNSKKRVEGNETKYRDLFHVAKDTNKKLEASEEKYRDFHEVNSNIDRFSNEVDFGLDGEIRLLDVGSCYNPFKNFDLFDKVTAIDLAPATEDVLQCDFLNLNIVSGDSSFLIPASSTCTELPGDYFDVVVFSLLLEYLPCRKQRWSCCLNAYKLLKPGGLLVIIPPDSKHASANSKLIKSWRLALASLGFMLVKCEKQQHVNCLAYRKCFNRKVAEYWLTLQKPEGLVPEDMICIPQDFNDYKEDECDVERVVLDREAIVGDFSELPSFED